MPFPAKEIPQLARVRQSFPAEHIADVRTETCERLLAAGLAKQVRKGARIAITAGSRGIGGFLELILGIADAIKAAGGKPFIVPAMGSHGGGTADGQKQLLQLLGISDKTANAPLRSTMDTLTLGTSESGAVAHLDKFAARADGIIVLGRVIAHPENKAGVASGLLKMVTIGLGKQAGA